MARGSAVSCSFFADNAKNHYATKESTWKEIGRNKWYLATDNDGDASWQCWREVSQWKSFKGVFFVTKSIAIVSVNCVYSVNTHEFQLYRKGSWEINKRENRIPRPLNSSYISRAWTQNSSKMHNKMTNGKFMSFLISTFSFIKDWDIWIYSFGYSSLNIKKKKGVTISSQMGGQHPGGFWPHVPRSFMFACGDQWVPFDGKRNPLEFQWVM